MDSRRLSGLRRPAAVSLACLVGFALVTLAGCGAVSGSPLNKAAGAAISCKTDAECVPATCCHSNSCVHVSLKPDCDATPCTRICEPMTLDCGGSCACVEGKCQPGKLYAAPEGP